MWLGLGLGTMPLLAPETEPDARSAEEPASDPALEGVVLMAPDLPDDKVDERLIARVQAASAEAETDAPLHVVRYDPARFKASTLVEQSRRRAGERMAAAVMWLDLRGPDAFAIYLYEAEDERVLGRRVPIIDGSTAAAHETLANIATSVVSESMAGPVRGLTELDPQTLEEPEPQPDPAPPPPEPAKLEPKPEQAPEPQPPPPVPEPLAFPRLWLSLVYAGSSFAQTPRWSHGLGLSMAWGPARGAFLGVRYDLVLPLVVDEPGVRFELRRHPIAAEGGYRFVIGEGWDLELAGRITVDPIRRLTDDRSDLMAAQDGWRWFSGAALGLGIGYAPIRELRLGVRIGAEAMLTRANYAVFETASRPVLEPHPARAFLEVGLHFGTLWRTQKN